MGEHDTFGTMAGPGTKLLSALRSVDAARFETTLREAMYACDGRVNDAATVLGVSRITLYRWLTEFPGIPRAPVGVRRNSPGRVFTSDEIEAAVKRCEAKGDTFYESLARELKRRR